jgi:hypothetical protein
MGCCLISLKTNSMKKPITPTIHGILDYALAGVQMIVPAALGFNKKVVRTYLDLGAGFFGVNALSNTPVGIKRMISMKDHQRADAAFLTTLTLLTFTKTMEKDKRALAFHFGMLALSLAHYALTDYDDEEMPLRPADTVPQAALSI